MAANSDYSHAMAAGETIKGRPVPKRRAPRLSLVIAHSPDPAASSRALSLSLEKGAALELGRDAVGDLRIADPRLSSRHLRISAGDTGIVIEDLGTTNGTYVDRARLTKPRELVPGQVIAAGDTRLVVDREVDSDHLPASPASTGALAGEVVGTSLAAQQLRRSLETVGASHGAVLILGETGTGKEVAAGAIHRLSKREGPFVAVNCAAIPPELAEAELFGYRRGAFTGAATDRDGHFVRAQGGTLFLDEVGEIPPQVQAKLLRVLEEGVVQPLGGGAPITVDVRVVSATLADLDARGFRKDLLARLGDWTLRVPPLRDRRADILPLFRHFRATEIPFTAEFAEALLLYAWPLNVRELKKLTLRLGSLAAGSGELDLLDLPNSMQAPFHDSERADPEETEPAEPKGLPDRETLEAALREARGNVRKVATDLGLHRNQIYRLLEKHGLELEQFR